MTKAQYWWVSVGGNPCEPAVVTGKRAWTFGSPDPFSLPSNIIELVERMPTPPETPAEAKNKAEAWQRKLDSDAAKGIFHGYRRF
jgi:hypothetical protein